MRVCIVADTPYYQAFEVVHQSCRLHLKAQNVTTEVGHDTVSRQAVFDFDFLRRSSRSGCEDCLMNGVDEELCVLCCNQGMPRLDPPYVDTLTQKERHTLNLGKRVWSFW